MIDERSKNVNLENKINETQNRISGLENEVVQLKEFYKLEIEKVKSALTDNANSNETLIKEAREREEELKRKYEDIIKE